jgi:hypothetical protein
MSRVGTDAPYPTRIPDVYYRDLCLLMADNIVACKSSQWLRLVKIDSPFVHWRAYCYKIARHGTQQQSRISRDSFRPAVCRLETADAYLHPSDGSAQRE